MAVTSNIANSRAKYSELNEDARESLGAKGMDEIYKKVAKKEEKRKQEPQNNAIVKVHFLYNRHSPDYKYLFNQRSLDLTDRELTEP